MDWSTRVTDLLGTKYPIIQGAFGGFGTSAIAGRVSDAGGCGIITAGALKSPENLRADIRRAREMTDKPFGVNISMVASVMALASEYCDVVIEEKVPVLFTAVYKADEIGRRAQAAGIKWIHKVATIEHALAAEQQGVDAVVLVGIEGAGFKSKAQLPTLIGITTLARMIKVPVIAAGGIGDARGFLAALAMGAEGVYMGTRFMATVECNVPERLKESYVAGRPEDPKYRDLALVPPRPEDLQRVMAQRGPETTGEWLSNLERNMISGSASSESSAAEAGPSRMTTGSLAVGVIDSVPTCRELIEGMIGEAERLLTREGALGRIVSGRGR
jgi:nitronate monooxygenase